MDHSNFILKNRSAGGGMSESERSDYRESKWMNNTSELEATHKMTLLVWNLSVSKPNLMLNFASEETFIDKLTETGIHYRIQ